MEEIISIIEYEHCGKTQICGKLMLQQQQELIRRLFQIMKQERHRQIVKRLYGWQNFFM